jgi:hypothetical protein
MGWVSNANGRVLIQKEVTYKTAPTGTGIAAIAMPFNSCDLKVDQKPQQSNILGAGRHAGRPFYGNKAITGNLTGPVDLIAIGYILKMVFGAPTTTGSASPYTHTFKVSSSTLSFLLEKGWPIENKYYLYLGCKAMGLQIGFGGGKQLQYTIPIIAASETYSGSSYQDTPTTDVTKPTTVFFEQSVTVTEGGSPSTELSEIQLNIGNGSVMGFGLGGASEGTVASEGSPTVDGTIKGLFANDTIIAKGRTKTESSLSVILTASAYSLTLAVDELEYSHESPAINGPGGALLDLSFIGYYQNDSDASEIRAVLVNSQASYA